MGSRKEEELDGLENVSERKYVCLCMIVYHSHASTELNIYIDYVMHDMHFETRDLGWSESPATLKASVIGTTSSLRYMLYVALHQGVTCSTTSSTPVVAGSASQGGIRLWPLLLEIQCSN